MFSLLRTALVLFLLLTLVTGVAYPLAVNGIAQLTFPAQANGLVIFKDGHPVGSSLIGQDFSQGPDAPKYFWGRLSATAPVPCTAFNADKGAGSTGSNLGPINPSLTENAKARLDALKAADDSAGFVRQPGQPVPVDLVTSSGSGLDPHISIAAAEYQLQRVAKSRGMPDDAIRRIVRSHTEDRFLSVLGEPVVNVLELNLALDAAGQ